MQALYTIETTDGEVLLKEGYYFSEEIDEFIHNLEYEFDLEVVCRMASIPNKVVMEHKDADDKRKEDLMRFIMERMDNRERELLLAFLSNRCEKISFPQIKNSFTVSAVVNGLYNIRKQRTDFQNEIIAVLRNFDLLP